MLASHKLVVITCFFRIEFWLGMLSYWLILKVIGMEGNLFSFSIGLFVIFYFYYKSIEFGITNLRIVKKLGIISRATAELRLEAVESVSMNQSILGRIFGFGTIIVSGRGTSKVYMGFVKDPIRAKQIIEEIFIQKKSAAKVSK
ncbi:MAG: PH domain-containing protein [Proteobacteria bacterium]|nr:PH domain-containing protein [Pseudomonadota bacterium]